MNILRKCYQNADGVEQFWMTLFPISSVISILFLLSAKTAIELLVPFFVFTTPALATLSAVLQYIRKI